MTNTLILAGENSNSNVGLDKTHSKFDLKLGERTIIEEAIINYSLGKTTIAISSNSNLPGIFNDQVATKEVGRTQGALITALIATEGMDLQSPLTIVPGDALISRNSYMDFLAESISSGCDLSLVVFQSNNPDFSYVRTLGDSIVEVTEKKVISSLATAGIFYFSSVDIFHACGEWSIINNITTQNLFFLAPSINYAIINGLKIRLYNISESDYFRFSNYDNALISKKRYLNEEK